MDKCLIHLVHKEDSHLNFSLAKEKSEKVNSNSKYILEMRAVCHVINTCISLCHHLYFVNQVLARFVSQVLRRTHFQWSVGDYPLVF